MNSGPLAVAPTPHRPPSLGYGVTGNPVPCYKGRGGIGSADPRVTSTNTTTGRDLNGCYRNSVGYEHQKLGVIGQVIDERFAVRPSVDTPVTKNLF